jgi:hypothetical protein
MCPDNDTPAPAEQNPTLAEDDKFRRTITPSEGPNKDGLDAQVKAAHTRAERTEPAINSVLAKVETTMGTDPSPALDDAAVKSDIEPSMPAPDAVPMPSPSAVREG